MTSVLERGVDDPAQRSDQEVPRKSRQGSETRQRTERKTLRLLPAENVVAEALAKEFDTKTVQALIVDALQPVFTAETLARVMADPEALEAWARARGLTTVQAAVLQALELAADSPKAS